MRRSDAGPSGKASGAGEPVRGGSGGAGELRPAVATPSFELQYLKAWVQSRSRQVGPSAPEDGRDDVQDLFTQVFNRCLDGISIHAPDFTILGVNTTLRSWYASPRPLAGRKCFEAYHGRTAPCARCPSLVAARTGRAHVGTVPYQVSGRIIGHQELSAFPLHDEEGRLSCVVEYVRDVTGLEHDARAVQHLKRRIQAQEQVLREQETALAVLLRHARDAERRVTESVVQALEGGVLPTLARLRRMELSPGMAREIGALDARLREITGTGSGPLSRALRGLTGREREVASLVRQGESSKEIASRLGVSTKAVEFHRTNIRRKVPGGSSRATLRSLLLDLDGP